MEEHTIQTQQHSDVRLSSRVAEAKHRQIGTNQPGVVDPPVAGSVWCVQSQRYNYTTCSCSCDVKAMPASGIVANEHCAVQSQYAEKGVSGGDQAGGFNVTGSHAWEVVAAEIRQIAGPQNCVLHVTYRQRVWNWYNRTKI